jgi:hypothetical protein
MARSHCGTVAAGTGRRPTARQEGSARVCEGAWAGASRADTSAVGAAPAAARCRNRATALDTGAASGAPASRGLATRLGHGLERPCHDSRTRAPDLRRDIPIEFLRTGHLRQDSAPHKPREVIPSSHLTNLTQE